MPDGARACLHAPATAILNFFMSLSSDGPSAVKSFFFLLMISINLCDL